MAYYLVFSFDKHRNQVSRIYNSHSDFCDDFLVLRKSGHTNIRLYVLEIFNGRYIFPSVEFNFSGRSLGDPKINDMSTASANMINFATRCFRAYLTLAFEANLVSF